jgi:hypothetical protein
VEFFPQSVDFCLLFVDDAVLHLHQQESTFSSFTCSSLTKLFSDFRV